MVGISTRLQSAAETSWRFLERRMSLLILKKSRFLLPPPWFYYQFASPPLAQHCSYCWYAWIERWCWFLVGWWTMRQSFLFQLVQPVLGEEASKGIQFLFFLFFLRVWGDRARWGTLRMRQVCWSGALADPTVRLCDAILRLWWRRRTSQCSRVDRVYILSGKWYFRLEERVVEIARIGTSVFLESGFLENKSSIIHTLGLYLSAISFVLQVL